MHERATSLLSVAEVTRLIDRHFPQAHEGGGRLEIERIDQAGARVRMREDPRMLRPGGTVSGPMMFKLADFGVYVAVLGRLGEAAVPAVTSSLTMNFLTRPSPGDLIAEVRMLRLGRRLAVAEVELTIDGGDAMVAHATATYALPSS